MPLYTLRNTKNPSRGHLTIAQLLINPISLQFPRGHRFGITFRSGVWVLGMGLRRRDQGGGFRLLGLVFLEASPETSY